jgi:hypothetical protein
MLFRSLKVAKLFNSNRWGDRRIRADSVIGSCRFGEFVEDNAELVLIDFLCSIDQLKLYVTRAASTTREGLA